jgi:hypothetical protein
LADLRERCLVDGLSFTLVSLFKNRLAWVYQYMFMRLFSWTLNILGREFGGSGRVGTHFKSPEFHNFNTHLIFFAVHDQIILENSFIVDCWLALKFRRPDLHDNLKCITCGMHIGGIIVLASADHLNAQEW